MKIYKRSLVLGTSLLALGVFIPLSAQADDITAPITCNTTDSNGNAEGVASSDSLCLQATKPAPVVCPPTYVTPDPVEDREGGDGGGSDGCCFFSGTKILMADGSLKTVEAIEEGDTTALGIVQQKLARHYDYARQHNQGNGCMLYKGVYVTGLHVAFSGEEWIESQNLTEATPSNPPQGAEQTFNLIVEGRIIPVIGNSGLIYFADNLNNVGSVSEYSLKMMQEDSKNTA